MTICHFCVYIYLYINIEKYSHIGFTYKHLYIYKYIYIYICTFLYYEECINKTKETFKKLVATAVPIQ